MNQFSKSTENEISAAAASDIIKNKIKTPQHLLIDNVFKSRKVSLFIENGNSFEGILELSKVWEANLIILGTLHGRTGLSHLLMGNVAEKIVPHSAVPLFIITIY